MFIFIKYFCHLLTFFLYGIIVKSSGKNFFYRDNLLFSLGGNFFISFVWKEFNNWKLMDWYLSLYLARSFLISFRKMILRYLNAIPQKQLRTSWKVDASDQNWNSSGILVHVGHANIHLRLYYYPQTNERATELCWIPLRVWISQRWYIYLTDEKW